MFKGIITALVTPFKNGKVDEQAYRSHIEWQISQGVHGLIPCGTTGESATLSHIEHEEVIRICIEQVNKRVPVIAGAGSNNTFEAINLTKFAKDAGADAVLHINPYYNKPSQEGLFKHFEAITSAVDLPLFTYNVPSRTGINMKAETVARIFKELPNVVGIKEAAGDIVQISDMLEYCDRKICLLSGDDFNFLPALAIGAEGVISVSANVAPRAMVDLYEAYNKLDMAKAQELHYRLQPLHRAMFMDVNPVPVKTALHLMGRMEAEFRLPLCNMSDAQIPALKKALAALDINV